MKDKTLNSDYLEINKKIDSFFDICLFRFNSKEIHSLLKSLPSQFEETYNVLKLLKKRLMSKKESNSLNELYNFKKKYSGDSSKLMRLVDHIISQEIERLFYLQEDWEVFHSLLLMDNKFGLSKDFGFNDHPVKFKVLNNGEYYFNSNEDYSSLSWLLDAKQRRIKMISYASVKISSCKKDVRNIEEILDLFENNDSTYPFKLYIPKIEINELPLNNGKPIKSSFGYLKGYWEEDDMNEEYNRFEVIIGKREINGGVSLSSQNCSDNDI